MRIKLHSLENTKYKISIGSEEWDGKYHNVVKIKMIYDGVIAGRRSPSYPSGKDDLQRVIIKAQELIAKR